MRIGIDAMGGDTAPSDPVKGALVARELLGPDDEIVLIGAEEAILAELGDEGDWSEKISVRHAPEAVEMNESPVEALRQKPSSSIAVMAQMQSDGQIDAGISAGNTGACVAAFQMRLRRLEGVHRPGITIVTPTYRGPVAICDVGANVNCRPLHLYQYGVMASVYLRAVCGIAEPRVGLLSIGQEDAKGNELVKQARELLKGDKRIHFIGNVEGQDVFRGVCDVMVCEGFVGNVMLKLMEGMAQGVMQSMLGEMVRAMPEYQQAIYTAGGAVASRYDFNEYGGAPLLGAGGICIICHGASNYRGIKNAVRVAVELSRHHVNDQIVDLLSAGLEGS